MLWAWRKGFIIKPPPTHRAQGYNPAHFLGLSGICISLRQTSKREETNSLSLYFQTLRFTNHLILQHRAQNILPLRSILLKKLATEEFLKGKWTHLGLLHFTSGHWTDPLLLSLRNSGLGVQSTKLIPVGCNVADIKFDHRTSCLWLKSFSKVLESWKGFINF